MVGLERTGSVPFRQAHKMSHRIADKEPINGPLASIDSGTTNPGKHAKVKLLVAYWAHFINNTDQYLKSLLFTNNLCSSSSYNKCRGKIEIKYYVVPGFNSTGPAVINGTNVYPGYTRVNHGKYAVSDVRAHIGTSNLMWDYFYTTAGISFGTYNAVIVSQLREIFDADWSSPYAVAVEPLEDRFLCSS
ncbi:phospholipase D4 [Striga asiatica]|uniref:Phospholipase D4 n=1 Tax=Striga asiatica TaxID=4170 RepID=A0A5A7PVB0_STRAF|nr:phospholipase D4 [Striga asiatica]